MTGTSHRAAALTLTQAGLVVIPVDPRTKKPLVEWKDVTTASVEAVEQFWEAYPNAAPAILCGPSRIVVVDLDRNHADGADGVAEFEKRAAAQSYEYTGPIVTTPNGGQHLYFRQPSFGEIRNRAGVLPGVDVRGVGGYVVAPGAQRPDGTGWHETGSVSISQALFKNSLPDFPDWLLDDPAYREQSGQTTSKGKGEFRAGISATLHLGQVAGSVEIAKRGTRNDVLNSAAFSMGRYVARGDIEEGHVREVLLNAAERCGLISDDGIRAAEATIASGLAAGIKQRSSAPADIWPKQPIPYPPELLFRPLADPTPYPLDHLGEVMGNAARAIAEVVQCAPEIAAQSVLGAASLSTQAHADVVLPNGQTRPLSLFLLTVAESGERKSSADSRSLAAVVDVERELDEQYRREKAKHQLEKAAWDEGHHAALKHGKNEDLRAKAATIRERLAELDPEPLPPLEPLLTSPDPTIEGLAKLFANGRPSLGIFSDEGGLFVGGHAMNSDNKLRTIGGLSNLWDGAPVKRVRSGDGTSYLPGRRLALHLMMQPDVASTMLNDRTLSDQGFLSRVLVTAPNPRAGSRRLQTGLPEHEDAIQRFRLLLGDHLRRPLPLADGTRNVLAPRRLPLAAEAAKAW